LLSIRHSRFVPVNLLSLKSVGYHCHRQKIDSPHCELYNLKHEPQPNSRRAKKRNPYHKSIAHSKYQIKHVNGVSVAVGKKKAAKHNKYKVSPIIIRIGLKKKAWKKA